MMIQLRQIDQGLWTADDPDFRVLGLGPIGTRMTVVELPGRGLLLISPIRLSPELENQIRGLGEVVAIIAPNRVHYLFAAEARKKFQQAKLLAAPGLPEKRPQIRFDGLVTDPEQTPWRDELEVLPASGFPFLNEVVLYHPRTRTLILTDLCFNLHRAPGWVVPLFRLNDMWRRFGPIRIFRLLIRDRRALRESLDVILSRDFDRVIVAHGDILEGGGNEALREAYAFLYH